MGHCLAIPSLSIVLRQVPLDPSLGRLHATKLSKLPVDNNRMLIDYHQITIIFIITKPFPSNNQDDAK
jgi:hypothetical protein